MDFQQGADRVERAARNQSLFRQVNERLKGLAETFQQVANNATFACECADPECVDHVDMSLDDYESVRSDPNQFAVLPGHVYPDVENVVREHERFVVVSKMGVGAEIAAAADPRS